MYKILLSTINATIWTTTLPTLHIGIQMATNPGVFLAVSSSSLNGVTGLDSGSTGTPIVQETSRRKDHGTIGIEVQVQYQSIRTDPGSRTLSNNEQ
ncbi:unnamed protein product [Aspergillus oryzae]|uniref:Unnamed protein product n=2 Tax=Aspergillus oryzae TaxID=5062 RepID=A0AAN4YDC4_ASPOZ|nr:unnamed protein product [Aspergillus oryzae]GMF90216.1 unnamed protein product [Aspergillus oryzae]GMG07756.1 unnamed protein product [Aspergillus oryzae]GMG24844.1 unnamed protein product [Aspergillus oryzae]GMG48065.1 unnamed protein product [Aspergillus oryzae var. brunneus]